MFIRALVTLGKMTQHLESSFPKNFPKNRAPEILIPGDFPSQIGEEIRLNPDFEAVSSQPGRRTEISRVTGVGL